MVMLGGLLPPIDLAPVGAPDQVVVRPMQFPVTVPDRP